MGSTVEEDALRSQGVGHRREEVRLEAKGSPLDLTGAELHGQAANLENYFALMKKIFKKLIF
jgi:hypothetical protein